MSTEYQALRAKVDAFTTATFSRRQADMACRAGCESCCHVWLSVSPVEAAQIRSGILALPPEERQDLAARGRRELAREAAGESEPRCAMLRDSGECAVYAERPLVCRTQGHALRYPAGFVPLEAVRASAKSGVSDSEITYCPLNYTEHPPGAPDVLDAERVDQLLAIVNHRFESAAGRLGQARSTLSELACEGDMLGCSENPG